MGSVHQQRLTDINVSFDFSVQVFPSGRCHPFSLRSTDRQVSYGAGLWEGGFFLLSAFLSTNYFRKTLHRVQRVRGAAKTHLVEQACRS